MFCFFSPSGEGEGVKRKRAEGRDTSANLAVGVMVEMEASEGQCRHLWSVMFVLNPI